MKISSFCDIIYDMEKVLIIAEDNVSSKLKTFMDDINEKGINHEVCNNLLDTIDAVEKYKENADIVVLDCGMPEREDGDPALYGGLEIIPRLLQWNKDMSIILNTPAMLPYDALPLESVIYVSGTKVWISRMMEAKVKNDERLHSVLDSIRKNNRMMNKDKQEFYTITDLDR